MANSSGEHSWFLERMDAFAAGLLDEVEEARFRTHLTDCPECETQWRTRTEAQDPDVADGGHIPSAVIARWDRALKTLRGLERAMVRQHLKHCSQCRQDLQVLGFEPTMDVVPELEMQTEIRPETSSHPGEEPSSDGSRVPSEQNVIRIIQPTRPQGRAGWWGWAFAGWAAVATAAVVLVLVGREVSGPPPSRLGADAIPWVQPTLERGDAGRAGLEVPRGTRTIILAVGIPPGVPAGRSAVIEVFSPTDERLTRVVLESQDLRKRAVMIPLTLADGFEPGQYRVLFWKGDPTESETQTVESFFELLPSES